LTPLISLVTSVSSVTGGGGALQPARVRTASSVNARLFFTMFLVISSKYLHVAGPDARRRCLSRRIVPKFCFSKKGQFTSG
jgi:hypothetical protein